MKKSITYIIIVLLVVAGSKTDAGDRPYPDSLPGYQETQVSRIILTHSSVTLRWRLQIIHGDAETEGIPGIAQEDSPGRQSSRP
jgi:hypothetical protein